MRLSKKKAIELCIVLWTWLAKTGKKKWEWPGWNKYGDINNYCWFCEYTAQKNYGCVRCDICIYHKKYGHHCNRESLKTYYSSWANAKTPRTRKKYAKLFLEQIKQCK